MLGIAMQKKGRNIKESLGKIPGYSLLLGPRFAYGISLKMICANYLMVVVRRKARAMSSSFSSL